MVSMVLDATSEHALPLLMGKTVLRNAPASKKIQWSAIHGQECVLANQGGLRTRVVFNAQVSLTVTTVHSNAIAAMILPAIRSTVPVFVPLDIKELTARKFALQTHGELIALITAAVKTMLIVST